MVSAESLTQGGSSSDASSRHETLAEVGNARRRVRVGARALRRQFRPSLPHLLSTVTASRPATAPAAPNPVALRLGYAGLIPFVLGAALVWLLPPYSDEHVFALEGMAKYAALIVSFLGGIHWGLGFRATVPSPGPFAWGVVPALLAWIAVLMPAYAGLVVLGALLIVCYVVDRKAYRAHDAEAWLTLRFRLSAVAALSCFLAAAGS